jgi:hypothetical protein
LLITLALANLISGSEVRANVEAAAAATILLRRS